MDIEELRSEFVKALKQSIHTIDGSQQKAFVRYMSIIGTRNDTKSPAEVMKITWNKYQKSHEYGKDNGLALYLNQQMMNEFHKE